MKALVRSADEPKKNARPEREAAAQNAERGHRVRTILNRLRDRLDLSDRDLGKMLKADEKTVRRWADGIDVVPIAFMASLTPHAASLARLEEILNPDRIAEAIRRPVPLFEGRSALDWILDGRFSEVVDRYDVTFRYQA